MCHSAALPQPLLQVLQQLRTSLAPGRAESAAATAAAAGTTGNTDSLASSWPCTLGADGVAAAAQLITR
jgi:hypothetical protein